MSITVTGIKVNGVEFECEAEMDGGNKIDSLTIVLKDSEIDLNDVLDDKVLRDIENAVYLKLADKDSWREDNDEDR